MFLQTNNGRKKESKKVPDALRTFSLCTILHKDVAKFPNTVKYPARHLQYMLYIRGFHFYALEI